MTFVVVVSSILPSSGIVLCIVLSGVLCKFSHNFFHSGVTPPFRWMLSSPPSRTSLSDATEYYYAYYLLTAVRCELADRPS